MTNERLKLDIDESQIHIFMPADGAIRKQVMKLENFVNTFDGINHNGIPDLQEFGGAAIDILPLLASLSRAIDFEKAAEKLEHSDIIKDHKELASALKQFGKVAEKAGTLLEAGESLTQNLK